MMKWCFLKLFNPFGFNAMWQSSEKRPVTLYLFDCVSTLGTLSALNANFQRDLGWCARSRKLAALCKAMKQQYAWLLNHISADLIKQRRTKLSPKSRHKEHSWAIESTGPRPHLLHHIPHGLNPDMFSVGPIAASWQSSNTFVLCGSVIINCS